MHVLVTGAAGTVGRWVVRAFVDAGHAVRALDTVPLPDDLDHPKIEAVTADITDPNAIIRAAADIDSVVHLAAVPTPRLVPRDELLRINVVGTENVIAAAEENGIPRIIITSSVGALGFSFPIHPCPPDYLPVDIAHPRRPQDEYGLSKLMNEESAAAATRRSGMTSVVLRPSWVGDLEQLAAGGALANMAERWTCLRHDSLWAYIDVRDLARAYLRAIEAELTGHSIFFVMADDVLAVESPRELIARHIPSLLPRYGDFEGDGFYDLCHTREKLGFVAKRRWR